MASAKQDIRTVSEMHQNKSLGVSLAKESKKAPFFRLLLIFLVLVFFIGLIYYLIQGFFWLDHEIFNQSFITSPSGIPQVVAPQ